MTVQDLIDRLQDFEPDTEVRLMTQQSWPFENEVAGLCDGRDLKSEEPCDCGEPGCEDCDPEKQEAIVYIVEGGQLGYGNKNAWSACS